jgi:hypothetical protein
MYCRFHALSPFALVEDRGCSALLETSILLSILAIYRLYSRTRAAERLAGARGKFFFRDPYFKIFQFRRTTPPPPRRQLFRSKNFPDEYVAIAFQGLYLNFRCQISVFSPKNRYRVLGPNKKFSGAPSTSVPGAICPPAPPSRRP